MTKNEEWVTCEHCGQRYTVDDLQRVCSNCFACVACRIYTCWNCKNEIVVVPLKKRMTSTDNKMKNDHS